VYLQVPIKKYGGFVKNVEMNGKHQYIIGALDMAVPIVQNRKNKKRTFA
jgi:hypothetical protein